MQFNLIEITILCEAIDELNPIRIIYSVHGWNGDWITVNHRPIACKY